MLLEVILVNFNEKITQIIMILIMMLHFELAGSLAIICSNKGRKNNRYSMGIKKNNRQVFLRSAGKKNRWIFRAH